MTFKVLALMSAVLVGAGCLGTGGYRRDETVRGQAFYRERLAVPPGTVLEVVLEDISLADAPAKIVGDTIITDAGQPPYTFEIRYRPEQIDASHRYTVRARLTHNHLLLFTTDQIYPVITGGHPTEVQLLLRRTLAPRAQAAVAEGAPGMMPATFTGDLPCADCEAIDYHLDLFADRSFYLRTIYRGKPGGPFDDIGSWALSSDAKVLVLQGGRRVPVRFSIESPDALRLMNQDGEPIVSNLNYALKRASRFAPIEPRLALRGMYSYMADAGTFTECLTGRKMPVAMEGDNRALEAAYTKTRREPGEALPVTLEGRIAQRMPMEGSGPVPTLVPERFIGVSRGETCGARFTTADLLNTYWKLTRLGNEAAMRVENEREPHIMLRDDNRLAGADGCNLMVGTYRLDGNTVAFLQTASTMMACPQGLEQAQRFRAALAAATRYRVVGPHLELFDGEGTRLACFEEVARK